MLGFEELIFILKGLLSYGENTMVLLALFRACWS